MMAANRRATMQWRGKRIWLTLMIGLLSLVACTSQPQPKPIHDVPGGDIDRGRQAIADYGCGACHTIPGVTGADALVGPSLAGWAKRDTLAGQFPNTPEYLIPWIQNPQAMAPGTVMPNLGVPEGSARDISLYLYTLQRNPALVPWW